MDRKQVLQALYEEKMQEIFEYAANYLMTVPKKGYEREFYKAKEITDVLEEMLEEI